MAFTPVQQNQFLEALASTGIIASACRTAGVSYATVTALRKSNDDFATAWDIALETATDSLEAEARRRALEGYQEPVIHQGQMTPLWERDPLDGSIVMEQYDTGLRVDDKPSYGQRPKQLVVDGVPQWLTIRKHSDSLLQFLLKGNRSKFKDSSKVELTGAGGGPLAIDDTSKAARLATLLAMAAERAKGDSFEDLA